MIGVLLVKYPGSGSLHYICVSDEGPMPPVDQLKLMTQYDTMACGVAVAESCGKKRGKTIPSDAQIGWDEGNEGKGASIQGVVNGLTAMQLATTVVKSTPKGPLDVMNPWGGVQVPPDKSDIWLNAAAVDWPDGWFIRVADAPAITEEDDEVARQTIIVDSQGHYFRADGTWVTYLETGQEVADTRWVAKNVYGYDVKTLNPVGDIRAYGVPTNKRTADIMGVTFP